MTDRANLFTREDTLLGVCAGIADELGIDAIFPRLVFALGLFWSPIAMIVAYLALGIALALFRWAVPPQGSRTRPGRASGTVLM